MIINKIIIVVLGVVATLLTGSCTTTPSTVEPKASVAKTNGNQPSLQAIYSTLGKTTGKVYTLNPKSSRVRIYVFRGGRAAILGHNHVLSSPQFGGFVYLPEDGISAARFDLEFRLDQLEMDNPEDRSSLGSAFSTILTPGSIGRTREHMLSSFQANRFPFVRIHSLQVTGEAPKLAAKIQADLHGQQRDMWIPLSVEILPDHISATGTLVLRQSEFGVQPYSVLGGFLAVQDEVVIEFSLAGGLSPE